MLVLLQPGTNSRSIFLGLVRGLARAGHEPLVLELAPIWQALNAPGADRPRVMTEAAAALRGLVTEHRPDASIAMWGNALTTFAGGVRDGSPRTIFGVLDLPHLCWWLDAPHWAAEGTWAAQFGHPLLRCPSLTHVINNGATAREMTEVLGFGTTAALPYAIDEEVFRPYPDEPVTHDVVVSCGPGDPPPTALALKELESDAPDMHALREEAANSASRMEGAGGWAEGVPDSARVLLRPLVNALLDTQLADRHTPMLERVCRLAAADHAEACATLLADPRLFVRVTSAVRSIETHERVFTIAWLSRRVRLAVFGATHPAWPILGDRLDDIAFEDMPRVYSRGLIGLNVMRWQDDEGINIKPFEIGASGVPCIMASRRGIEACFTPGREILTFETPDQALRLVHELRDAPTRREEIAGAAHARVLRDHTWARRAGQFVRALAPVILQAPSAAPPSAP